MTEQRKPLWEVMQSAYLAGRKPGFTDCHGYAAELRAIADEVVPEEPEPEPGILPCIWIERMKFRQRLLAAAAEAEGNTDG